MFLLPGNVPHSPIRYADTVGIVVEQNRPSDSIGFSKFEDVSNISDRLRWYCENCNAIVHEEAFHCTDLGTQVKSAVEKFAGSEELRTCKQCGTVAKTKLYDT
jgi:3-hydroxyanthranilate 3,4-dioxygenase